MLPIDLEWRLVGWDALKRCTLQKILNARPASGGRRRSQILFREMNSSEIAPKKITRVEAAPFPTFAQKPRKDGPPESIYLRMPSFPMTVL